mmetsp:Transcript_57244/g.124407  ORF Transcript_57244/g.124407 Transcript_57244/m.124407 type:complete len:240 (-) Transcript_57244:187-906(-)
MLSEIARPSRQRRQPIHIRIPRRRTPRHLMGRRVGLTVPLVRLPYRHTATSLRSGLVSVRHRRLLELRHHRAWERVVRHGECLGAPWRVGEGRGGHRRRHVLHLSRETLVHSHPTSLPHWSRLLFERKQTSLCRTQQRIHVARHKTSCVRQIDDGVHVHLDCLLRLVSAAATRHDNRRRPDHHHTPSPLLARSKSVVGGGGVSLFVAGVGRFPALCRVASASLLLLVLCLGSLEHFDAL